MTVKPTEAPESQPGLPPVVTPVPADLDTMIADKVALALQAILPTLMGSLTGATPSTTVDVTPTSVEKSTPYGHYRKDGVKVGKHVEFDMDCIDADTDRAFCVKKGSWIVFTSGHCYPETSNQQRQLDWMMASDPFCGIYRDEGSSVLPCPVNGCKEFFSNDKGLRAHMAATHGVR